MDFIDDLKKEILTTMPDISPDWAEMNALLTLSTCCDGVRIIEREGSLPLNILAMMIGPPGIKKTLPMFAFTKPILEGVNKSFILPSRSSVEGFIKYVSAKKKKTKKKDDEEDEESEDVGDYVQNKGIIIRDEFGGLFNQIRSTEWQSDAMEFISEMYDGNYQKRVTMKAGLLTVPSLYVTMLTATTYQFVGRVDAQFFTQGTGNRFLYVHFGADEYKPMKEDYDYFLPDWDEKHTLKKEQYINLLKNLVKFIDGKWMIMVSDSTEWLDYKYECEIEWKEKCMKDPLGWTQHPLKRYAELALKLAGIYEISKNIDRLDRESFTITEESMKRGIAMVELSRKHFDEIVKIKLRSVGKKEPKSLLDEARAFLTPLLDGKEMSTGDWFDKQDITGNKDLMNKLKHLCIDNGWVKERFDGRYSFVTYVKGSI